MVRGRFGAGSLCWIDPDELFRVSPASGLTNGTTLRSGLPRLLISRIPPLNTVANLFVFVYIGNTFALRNAQCQ